jgi:hypothetical protein
MFLNVKMEVLGDYQHLRCVKEAIEKAYVSSELTTILPCSTGRGKK